MQDRYVTKADAKIAYQLTGSGPTLGYAHGVFLSRAATSSPRLRHPRDRPPAADLRPARPRPLDGPIDFMGTSLSCDVALRAAITAPERFRHLVLIIPPVAWEEGPDQARQWYTDSARAIESHGAAHWRQEWAQKPPLPIFAGYPAFGLAPDILDDLLAPVLRGIGESDLPAQEAIAALPHPALILTWDTDPLLPDSPCTCRPRSPTCRAGRTASRDSLAR